MNNASDRDDFFASERIYLQGSQEINETLEIVDHKKYETIARQLLPYWNVKISENKVQTFTIAPK